MSKMSELHAWIEELIEDGVEFDEIAYMITCEHDVDFSDAYQWVYDVYESNQGVE